MKFRVLFSAALMSGVIAAQATTQNAAVSTNASPEAAMTALFGDPVIVKGDSFQIKRSDLDSVVSGARANAAANGQMLPADFDASVLNQLITIQVLLQKATPADQAAGKQEADIQYTNLLAKFVSPEAFERQLKMVGMTVDQLRAKATQEATAKAALKRLLDITVSDEEAKDYYAKHPADFEKPEQVHVQHILLMTIDTATHTALSSNTIAAKRKQIEDIRKRILAGEDFSTLARQYSEDSGTKENGGELPWFSRGRMVAEFEAAAFALQTNQVSDVVTSQYGFHIIKLLGRSEAKKIDYNTAETELKDGLARMKIAKVAPAYVKKLRTEEHVEIVDPKLKDLDAQLQNAEASAEAAASATNK